MDVISAEVSFHTKFLKKKSSEMVEYTKEIKMSEEYKNQTP